VTIDAAYVRSTPGPSRSGIGFPTTDTSHRLNEPEIRRLITDAGWQPQKRDYYYRPIG